MNFYSITAKSYNELHKEEQEQKLKIIKKYLKINKNTTLLDIGCGTGLSLKPFINKCKCIGIDPNEELLKLNPYPHIKAKAECLPFKDKSFDIVISITSLHHCNLKKAVKEIERVTKKQIAISFLKKSKKLKQIKNLLKGYKQIEQEKDIIFIKTI